MFAAREWVRNPPRLILAQVSFLPQEEEYIPGMLPPVLEWMYDVPATVHWIQVHTLRCTVTLETIIPFTLSIQRGHMHSLTSNVKIRQHQKQSEYLREFAALIAKRDIVEQMQVYPKVLAEMIAGYI